ncbi:MAG: hypothetical protein ACXW13_06880, partial [Burkholderiaceae bacterium]
MKPRRRFLLAALGLPLAAGAQPAFDHTHSAWDALLRKHVRLVSDGRGQANASQVNYRAMAEDRAALSAYLQ